MTDNPLATPIPAHPIDRIRDFARDWAWGVINERMRVSLDREALTSVAKYGYDRFDRLETWEERFLAKWRNNLGSV